MSTVPQIMISSTFFDLKQVRADLARFIGDELGCRPLISEWPSFPIDPDVDTIENCRRRVERDADILVLVMGGRYGSVDSQSAKSVTNLEYLAARAKGIPIFAFIERRILSVMSVWRANKNGDLSSVVDDTRIFTFIEEVREGDRVWTNEFDLAGDIISALRVQLAHLMLEGARLVARIRSDREYLIIRELQGAPLRIALEKSVGWEYKLFATILIQEIRLLRMVAEQKRLRISYGEYQYVDLSSLRSWSQPRLAELQSLIHASEIILNEELGRALGPPGEPGSIELLIFCARSLAGVYRDAVEWVFRLRRTVGHEKITDIATVMDRFADDLLDKLEKLGPLILEAFEEMERSPIDGPQERVIKFTLAMPGAEEATVAFARLARDLESLRNETL